MTPKRVPPSWTPEYKRAYYPAGYGVTLNGDAYVDFRGERVVEPPRDAHWRRQNLAHRDGRFTV